MRQSIPKHVLFFGVVILAASVNQLCACETTTTNTLTLEHQLRFAVADGEAKRCHKLLEQGADPNKEKVMCEYDYDTPLTIAVEHGYCAICKDLIDHKAKINARGCHFLAALHIAAKQGNYELCKLLLDNKADPNVKISCFGAMFSIDSTPLHLAAYYGHFEVCKLLIERGADVKANAGVSFTPAFDWAAQGGHLNICKLLVEHGASVSDWWEYADVKPEVMDYIMMARDFAKLKANKLTLKEFTDKQLNQPVQKKNIFDVIRFGLVISKDLAKQIWESCSNDLQTYYLLASDFELLKVDKQTVEQFTQKHLNKKNLNHNLSDVTKLVSETKSYKLTHSFMLKFANKLVKDQNDLAFDVLMKNK